MNENYDPIGYGLYSPSIPPSKDMFIQQAGDKARVERQQQVSPYAQGAGLLVGGLLGSIFPGGTMIGASLGSALGSSISRLFGGEAESEAEAEAGELYDQMASEQLWGEKEQSMSSIDEQRKAQMLFEIQNMRKNVMPNRTEYLKFV